MKRKSDFGDEPFVICHWDTFDNETFRVGGAKTLEEAEAFVEERYKGRIGSHGADKVDIVDSEGRVRRQYSVC